MCFFIKDWFIGIATTSLFYWYATASGTKTEFSLAEILSMIGITGLCFTTAFFMGCIVDGRIKDEHFN